MGFVSALRLLHDLSGHRHCQYSYSICPDPAASPCCAQILPNIRPGFVELARSIEVVTDAAAAAAAAAEAAAADAARAAADATGSAGCGAANPTEAGLAPNAGEADAAAAYSHPAAAGGEAGVEANAGAAAEGAAASAGRLNADADSDNGSDAGGDGAGGSEASGDAVGGDAAAAAPAPAEAVAAAEGDEQTQDAAAKVCCSAAPDEVWNRHGCLMHMLCPSSPSTLFTPVFASRPRELLKKTTAPPVFPAQQGPAAAVQYLDAALHFPPEMYVSATLGREHT